MQVKDLIRLLKDHRAEYPIIGVEIYEVDGFIRAISRRIRKTFVILKKLKDKLNKKPEKYFALLQSVK